MSGFLCQNTKVLTFLSPNTNNCVDIKRTSELISGTVPTQIKALKTNHEMGFTIESKGQTSGDQRHNPSRRNCGFPQSSSISTP